MLSEHSGMKLEINKLQGNLGNFNYVEIKLTNGPKKDWQSKRIISDEWKWIHNI